MRVSMTGVRSEAPRRLRVGSATVSGPDPAYGVFDTLLVRDGLAVDLAAHVDRVSGSVKALYDVHVDASGLAARIVADARGLDTARVRTSYDPGLGEWEIEATRIAVPALEPHTLVPRRLPDGLGAHKWRDRRLVDSRGEGDDVLLVDEGGLVLECGRANVFAVVGGQVVTPPLDGRILPGTVRARVLHLLSEGRDAVAERALALAELETAGEVFTTSSIRGVQPVTACVGVGAWPVGAVTTWLRTSLC
jgi:para-aminobenzoate synthetase/4-amino-4-deoxychorismate lyase